MPADRFNYAGDTGSSAMLNVPGDDFHFRQVPFVYRTIKQTKSISPTFVAAQNHMTISRTLLFSSCLLLFTVQDLQHPAIAAPKVTCASCPVTSVNPRATQSFEAHTRNSGCTPRSGRNGLPIPDPNCTTGAINPTVTLEVLKNPAYKTGCDRNCITSLSEKSAAYAHYGIAHPIHNTGQNQTCELDHLVPLEMGGADSMENIWPQCGPSEVALDARYFKQKDLVENYLSAQVKSGDRDLAVAQKEIAKDWTQFLGTAKEWCSGHKCAEER